MEHRGHEEGYGEGEWKIVPLDEVELLSPSGRSKLAAKVYDYLVQRVKGFSTLDISVRAERIRQTQPGLTYEDALLEVMQREGWSDER